MPGIPERRTNSYVRHGTTSLFAALDIASGFVIGKCYKRHRAAEFLDFLKQVDAQIPDGIDVHIIVDNYATHKNAVIKNWLAQRPHYHVHFTPTSASCGTMKIPGHIDGPNPQMKSSPPSDDSAKRPSEPYAANFRFT